jgi:hypothetical protein
LSSYQKHPAGIDHDLILIFKGFESNELTPDAAGFLSEISYQSIFVPDIGLDIGPYLDVSRHLNHSWLCFMNSFSEILVDGWLEMLFHQANQPGVGMVGATGTWESLLSDFENACRQNVSRLPHKRLLRMVNSLKLQRIFPAFPNPHLRSNSFLIDRCLFLRSWEKPIKSKLDAHSFESGNEGLSAVLRSQGLQLLVVGKDGVGYTQEKWHFSRTFRSGNQENLIVADNQTRNYKEATQIEKNNLIMKAWGGGSSE